MDNSFVSVGVIMCKINAYTTRFFLIAKTKMPTFQITMYSTVGVYQTESKEKALDLFAQDAGYNSWSESLTHRFISADDVSILEAEDQAESSIDTYINTTYIAPDVNQ